jgi:uncharacterized protein
MRRVRKYSGAVALLLCLTVAGLAAAQEFPQPLGKVNDFAQILDGPDRATLENQLDELERATSAEVAFVSVPNLGGRTVEDYATALFNTWGIGKKDKDNGVLVLVCVPERAMRIEVGYGLEGVMPDGLAGAVIRETMLPRFRGNDYRGGVLDGMARVIDIVRRNETLTPEQIAALDRAAADAGKSWVGAAFLSIFVGVGAFMAGSGAGAKVIVQMLFGLVFGGVGLFLSQFLAPRAAVITLAVFGVAMLAWSYRLGRRPKWKQTLRSAGTGSGWTMGTSGGSGSSSGSSSSGGSFGGGSSGGGGASGRW